MMDSENHQNKENRRYSNISQSHQAGPSQAGPSQAGPSQAGTSTQVSTSEEIQGIPLKSTESKTTRESKRHTKFPKVLSYDSFKDYKWQWSERDKKLFLAGCLEVGTENIEALKRFLPHKNELEIKRQIEMWKRCASRNVMGRLSKRERKKISNLDEWIDYFKELTNSNDASTYAMSNIFMLIAEYGKFPSLEECSGIDIRAMYRYLHCMMNGISPYGLNSLTSRVLVSCIDNVLEKLDDPSVKETYAEDLFISKKESEDKRRRMGKTYDRKKKNGSMKERIRNNRTINPLKLPEKACYGYLFVEESSDVAL